MIHITSTEIVSSLLLYSIVHGCLWVAKNAERFIITHADQILRLHVLHGHKAKSTECADGHCGELSSVLTIDQLTI